jgi:hypothetical protein
MEKEVQNQLSDKEIKTFKGHRKESQSTHPHIILTLMDFKIFKRFFSGTFNLAAPMVIVVKMKHIIIHLFHYFKYTFKRYYLRKINIKQTK